MYFIVFTDLFFFLFIKRPGRRILLTEKLQKNNNTSKRNPIPRRQIYAQPMGRV